MRAVSDYVGSAVKEKNVKLLCKVFWGDDVTEKQEMIIRKIAFKEDYRIIISAFTRYGKTWSVARGVCLYLLFNEGKHVLLVGPRKEQVGILRNYISELLVSHPVFVNLIDSSTRGKERLRKEVSKGRITFTNGCELKVLSAYGAGEALMGWGGDLVVLDESCLVSYNTYRQKISRMLGDNPDAILVEIGNPWNLDNHFWEHWNDPGFAKVHVDYRTGLEEGRITKKYVEEQREGLTAREFRILYEARFPEESEDVLFSRKDIDAAVSRGIELSEGDVIIGVDVARYGLDKTVITVVRAWEGLFEILYVEDWSGKPTTFTFGRIIELDNEYDADRVLVDDLGLGGGVTDMLKTSSIGSKCEGFVASSKNGFSDSDKQRFPNWKSKAYIGLSKLFKKGKIKVLESRELMTELSLLRVDYDSRGRPRVLDYPKSRESVEGERKSPNFADSLMIATSGYGGKEGVAFGFVDWR